MELPDFLIEMSKQINEQDNRMTSDPIFCVCYDEKLPTSEDYADNGLFEWYNPIECETIGNTDEDLIVYLIEHHPEFIKGVAKAYEIGVDDIGINALEWTTLPDDIYKIHLMSHRKIVKASLTEVGAQQFIDRKQHDYPKLYIYAESMCFQQQMIELRNWIMSLTKEVNNESTSINT